MPQNDWRVTVPTDPDPKWPEGYVAARPESGNWLVQQAKDSLEFYYEKFRWIALEPRACVPASISHEQSPPRLAPPSRPVPRAAAANPCDGIHNIKIHYTKPGENVKVRMSTIPSNSHYDKTRTAGRPSRAHYKRIRSRLALFVVTP